MVSQGGSPPVAMPVQVPPGHVMQQVVDEHRTLRHVILSTNHQMHAQSTVQDMPHLHGHYVSEIFLFKCSHNVNNRLPLRIFVSFRDDSFDFSRRSI